MMVINRRQVADVDSVYGPGCCDSLVGNGLAVIQERTPQQEYALGVMQKLLAARAEHNVNIMRTCWGATIPESMQQPQPTRVNRFAGVRVPERKVRQ